MITILVKYSGFGWVATSPELLNQTSNRCAGGRAAAEELAAAHFGAGNYTLKKQGARIFQAEVKP
jgi:hypothetical protein